MIKENLFHKTIGILVNAYMKGTLEHGDSCGCAFGNIIFKHKDRDSIFKTSMQEPFGNWYNVAVFGENYPYGLEQIQSTGYTIEEAAMIEESFEKFDSDFDEDGYLGLMSVVDCLAKIHEADLTETSTAKQLFIPA